MKVIDYITGNEIDFNQARKLNNDKYISSNDASIITDALYSSEFTTKDIHELHSTVYKLHRLIVDMLLALKKTSNVGGKSISYLIKQQIGKEDELAIERFKKTRVCLTPLEHIELIETFLNKQGFVSDIKTSEEEYRSGMGTHQELYTEGLSYEHQLVALKRVFGINLSEAKMSEDECEEQEGEEQ
jgi:hypothetical protein